MRGTVCGTVVFSYIVTGAFPRRAFALPVLPFPPFFAVGKILWGKGRFVHDQHMEHHNMALHHYLQFDVCICRRLLELGSRISGAGVFSSSTGLADIIVQAVARTTEKQPKRQALALSLFDCNIQEPFGVVATDAGRHVVADWVPR